MRRGGGRFPFSLAGNAWLRLLDSNRRGDGHAGAKSVVLVVPLEAFWSEVDSDGDALNDFDIVACGVLGWEERELGPGGSADLGNFAVELTAAEGVDFDGDFLAGTHPCELGFFEVCSDPEVGQGDDGEEILTDAEVGTYLHVLFIDDAGDGRSEVGIVEVEQRLIAVGLGLFDV